MGLLARWWSVDTTCIQNVASLAHNRRPHAPTHRSTILFNLVESQQDPRPTTQRHIDHRRSNFSPRPHLPRLPRCLRSIHRNSDHLPGSILRGTNQHLFGTQAESSQCGAVEPRPYSRVNRQHHLGCMDRLLRRLVLLPNYKDDGSSEPQLCAGSILLLLRMGRTLLRHWGQEDVPRASGVSG